jgi:hypothetical protein
MSNSAKISEYQRSVRAYPESVSVGEGELPLPRLQLSWERLEGLEHGFSYVCFYELAIPLQEADIRNEAKDGKIGGGVGFMRAYIGATMGDLPLGTPFRAGAHIKWDSESLGGLPMFLIAEDGSVEEIKPITSTGG